MSGVDVGMRRNVEPARRLEDLHVAWSHQLSDNFETASDTEDLLSALPEIIQNMGDDIPHNNQEKNALRDLILQKIAEIQNIPTEDIDRKTRNRVSKQLSINPHWENARETWRTAREINASEFFRKAATNRWAQIGAVGTSLAAMALVACFAFCSGDTDEQTTPANSQTSYETEETQPPATSLTAQEAPKTTEPRKGLGPLPFSDAERPKYMGPVPDCLPPNCSDLELNYHQ